MSPPNRLTSAVLLACCIPGMVVTSFTIQAKQQRAQTRFGTRPVAVPTLQAQSSSSSSSSNTKNKDSTTSERQPWEPLRFVRQSSKFINWNPMQKPSQRTIVPGEILWTPGANDDNKKNTFELAPLDDVVMGGVSSSTFDNDTGLWKGIVTDRNNGGFIGVRSSPPFEYNMEQCSGIQLKVKSTSPNVQRFKFATRDSTDFNGISWTTSIDIPGGIGPSSDNNVMKLFVPASTERGVTTIKIPFDKQVPTRFARIVPNQTFQKDNVVGVQLTYSKFEYDGDLNPSFALGDFSLQILEMSAY